MTSRGARPSARCGSCGLAIDKKTIDKLTLEYSTQHKQALLSQKKEFEKTIAELKASQKKALAKIAAAGKQDIKRIQRLAEEKSRHDRVFFDQEFTRLKTAYQASLAQTKEFHARQGMVAIGEIKDAISNSSEETKKIVSQVAQDTQEQLASIQNWLQAELPRQLVESVVSMSDSTETEETGPDVDELVREIGSKDRLIADANDRIKRLEDELSARKARTIWKRMKRSSPPEPYKEEPSDPQAEILNMIREISQERTRMEAARKGPEQRNLPEFTDSFGSRIAKKAIH